MFALLFLAYVSCLKKLINQLLLSTCRKSVMVPQLVFQVGEQTVQGVCRVRDVQFSPLFKDEQVRQVRDQASVCASELFMSIMRLAGLFVYSPLIQHMLPFLEPSVKSGIEFFFSNICKTKT